MVEHGHGSSFSLPRGVRLWRALRNEPTQEYLLYVPNTVRPNARVLVSLHGLARNAHEHATIFTGVCEEHGAVMVVPIFTEDLHKDYQRLGRKGRGERIDLMLNRMLAEVAILTRADVSKLLLFGYSGGAQFAHRYSMAHPSRVERAVVAAAGWYTFPDTKQRFPYGIKPARTLDGVIFNPEEFLRIPIQVLVGGEDTQLHNVRSTERTVAQQGTTRLDRARNWVAAMRKAAKLHSLEPRVTLNEIPGVGHSFADFLEQGALVKHVGRFLFPSTTQAAIRSETAVYTNGSARVG